MLYRSLRGGTGWVFGFGVALAALCFALAGVAASECAALTPAQAAGASGGAAGGAAPMGGQTINAARYAERVAIITIDREIDAHTQASVERRMRKAVESGAQAIVFDLNTPGGELGAVLSLCNSIKACPIKNTIAWVHPTAYSGGSIVALACREIIVSDNATMGDSLVIAVSFGMLNLLPEAERQKLTAPLLAEVVSSARLRGYDEQLVQGLVSLGVELWQIESVDAPGTYLYVTASEYETLFGAEPARGPARLTGAAPLPEDMRKNVEREAKAQADEAAAAARGDGGGGMRRERKPRNPDAGAIPRDEDASPLVPASTTMAAGAKGAADRAVRGKSLRPVLTSADRGKWRLVERVSDGRGVFTMKPEQLFRYGLAQPANLGGAGAGASGAAALNPANGTINSDEELKAFLGATTLARLDMNWAEHTAAALDHFIIKGVLIVVFLIAMFIEITHPGVVLPGCVAAAALLLLAAPMFFAGLAYWWALAAIVVGIGLLALEVFVLPGFGVFGIIALLALFAGLIGLILPAGSEDLFPGGAGGGSSRLLLAVATLVLSCLTAGVGMFFLGKHFGSLPLLNRLILHTPPNTGDAPLLAALGPAAGEGLSVGDEGEAVTPLRPAGRARIGGEMIDVVARDAWIAPGQGVRVVALEGMRTVVEGI
ncbi:hypothetical protein BH11PLA1_BH11PLA1_24370 [soil metagenome]